jgi:hypothetical protein
MIYKFFFKLSIILFLTIPTLNAREYSIEEIQIFATQTYIHKYKSKPYAIKVRYLHEARSFNVKGFKPGNLLSLTSKGLKNFWKEKGALFWSDQQMTHLFGPKTETKNYEKEFDFFFNVSPEDEGDVCVMHLNKKHEQVEVLFTRCAKNPIKHIPIAGHLFNEAAIKALIS